MNHIGLIATSLARLNVSKTLVLQQITKDSVRMSAQTFSYINKGLRWSFSYIFFVLIIGDFFIFGTDQN
ncbi:hypothetical protein HMPREF0021_01981 [Acinetobacter baumannii 6013150]|nr:hypothetical protein HMPREF0021_01981 [Acinetobacter baumannii 6013150]EGJ63076.1 hypothetical protein HMPREF0020_03302 [Acinetobacter baumannii 6013113]